MSIPAPADDGFDVLVSLIVRQSAALIIHSYLGCDAFDLKIQALLAPDHLLIMPHGVERMDFLHRLLDRLDLLIAGLLGVIVASWWHKDDLTDWRAWMIFLITGVSCSLYLTGMVSAYLGVTEPSIVAGIGFLLGTFGGSLLAAINRAIKAADLWALIRQRFGGGNPP